MSRVWGRAETYRWPSDKPVWTITALVLTVVAVLAAATHEYLREWTYFQQAYLGTYIGSEVRLWSKTTPSLIAYRIEGKQKRAAVDRDLSDPAVSVGKESQAKAKLEWERGTYNNAELRQWLERAIYGGQSPWLLLWAATWKAGTGVLVVGLALAIPRDRQRRRMRKYGRRTKGPELATAAQFNRANPSNGIGFLYMTISLGDGVCDMAFRELTRLGYKLVPAHGYSEPSPDGFYSYITREAAADHEPPRT